MKNCNAPYHTQFHYNVTLNNKATNAYYQRMLINQPTKNRMILIHNWMQNTNITWLLQICCQACTAVQTCVLSTATVECINLPVTKWTHSHDSMQVTNQTVHLYCDELLLYVLSDGTKLYTTVLRNQVSQIVKYLVINYCMTSMMTNIQFHIALKKVQSWN